MNNEANDSIKIKETIIREFERNERKGLYAYTQKTMAYNSNKIEGSTLTSEQTASLFDTGTIVSNGVEVYKAKDIEEMNGHFKMFNQMIKTLDQKLTPEMIKSYHYQLKSGVFEDIANGYPIGEYKNRANFVSDIQVSSPKDVPEKIKELIDWYYHSEKSLKDIVIFHAEYEHIHPFQDGNGRTGRMIMFKQCLDSNLVPVMIKDEIKQLYNRALHKAQIEGDYSNLLDICEQGQKDYLEKAHEFIDDSFCFTDPEERIESAIQRSEASEKEDGLQIQEKTKQVR